MNKKLQIICIGMLLLGLFSGCGSNALNSSPEYENYSGVVQSNTEYAEFAVTVKNQNKLYFQSVITEDEREQCVEIIDIFTAKMNQELSQSPKLTFYISEDVVTKGNAGEVWINTADINTMDAYTAMVQAYATEQASYGMAYGIACYICEQLELGADIPAEEADLTSFYEQDEPNQMLSLSLPQFDEEITTIKEVQENRMLARSLMRARIKERGFEKAFSNYAGAVEYYGFRKNLEKGSETYRYYWETQNAKYYFSSSDIQYKFSKYMENAHTYLETAERGMQEARDLLKTEFVNEPGVIPIYMDSAPVNDFNGEGGCYNQAMKSITICGDMAIFREVIVHEYMHYLLLDCCDWQGNPVEDWLSEAVPEYIAIYKLENTGKRQTEYEKLRPQSDMYKATGIEGKDEIDICRQNDLIALGFYYNEWGNITYYTTGGKSVERTGEKIDAANKLSYYEAASLVYYLMDEYGIEAFREFAEKNYGLQKAYGKTFPELYQEWAAYMSEKHADVLPSIVDASKLK